MLYTDREKRKVYVKVSGNFVEVNVKKDKDNNYTVIPTQAKRIEVYGNEDKYFEIPLERAYELQSKDNSSLKVDNENKLKINNNRSKLIK